MTDQEIWQCDSCFEMFYRPANACHEITIDGEKEHWCAECYTLHYKALKFVRHIQDHIANGDKGLKKTDKAMCKICDQTIDQIYDALDG